MHYIFKVLEVQIMGNHIRTMLTEFPQLSQLADKLLLIATGKCSHATQCYTPSANCKECRIVAKTYLRSIKQFDKEFSPSVHSCYFITTLEFQKLLDKGIPLKRDFYHPFIKVFYSSYNRSGDFGIYYVLLTPLNELFCHHKFY